ncbi:hypothetical protein D3C85_1922050 [compost metagenome]
MRHEISLGREKHADEDSVTSDLINDSGVLSDPLADHQFQCQTFVRNNTGEGKLLYFCEKVFE